MTDPASSTATLAITGAGITIFGVVTGLHPDILLAGFAGGQGKRCMLLADGTNVVRITADV